MASIPAAQRSRGWGAAWSSAYLPFSRGDRCEGRRGGRRAAGAQPEEQDLDRRRGSLDPLPQLAPPPQLAALRILRSCVSRLEDWICSFGRHPTIYRGRDHGRCAPAAVGAARVAVYAQYAGSRGDASADTCLGRRNHRTPCQSSFRRGPPPGCMFAFGRV